MGTRSLTVFKNRDDQEIVVMYRQFDGYPEGHGVELAQFLAGKKIVNGISGEKDMIFNGMGCLAAATVAHFKDGPGSFYLYPAGTRDYGEEYIYIVTGRVGEEPYIQVYDSYEQPDHLLKLGYASNILTWCKEPDHEFKCMSS